MKEDKIIAFVTHIIENGVASNLPIENIKSSILQFDKYLHDQNLGNQQSSVRLNIIVSMLPDIIEIYKANGPEFANNFILKTLNQVKLSATSEQISKASVTYGNPVRQPISSYRESVSSCGSPVRQSRSSCGESTPSVSSCGGRVVGRSHC